MALTGAHGAIAAGNEQFMAALRESNAAGLAALYTQDGQVLPPNGDVVTGREAIQTFWQAVINMGIRGADMNIVEVLDHGDIAVEVSRFVLYAADRQVADQGKYIVIWRQEEGQWKMYRDIFNSSMPLPT